MMSFSSVYIVFISTLLLLLSSSTTQGFGVVPPIASTHQQLADTSLSYRDHPVVNESPTLNITAEPGFEERTRAAVRSTTPTRTAGKKTTKTTSAGRPQLILQATTMEEFNELVTAEKDQLVVVRFHAPWCRACKAMAPSYFRFSRELDQSSAHDSIKFVDCPISSVSTVHKTLGIKTIPFAHVYHPEIGLVEERSLSRRVYSTFEKVVRSHVAGVCHLMDRTIKSSGEELSEEKESDDEQLASTYASSPW